MIYCCFHATGKSTLSKINSKFVDLDFHYLTVDEIINLTIENLSIGKTPLLPVWGILRQELDKRKINYTLVYPARILKEEYITRIRNRNKSKELEDNLTHNWDIVISNLEQSNNNKIVLNSGEFISDKINHEHHHSLPWRF